MHLIIFVNFKELYLLLYAYLVYYTIKYQINKQFYLNFIHRKISGQLIDYRAYHFKMSKLLCADVRDPIKFLREREIVHYQRFGEALRRTTDRLDSKNFYAFNPSFVPKK